MARKSEKKTEAEPSEEAEEAAETEDNSEESQNEEGTAKKKGRKSKQKLEPESEKEGSKGEESKVEKKESLASLKERAKQLEKGIPEERISIEKVKLKEYELSADRQKELIVPLEDYVKSGIHLGTKVISADMGSYVYRRRADGLAILNTNIIDIKIREAAKYLVSFKPEDIVVVCKREAGWTPARKFAELTGIKVFTKKYPAGIITNLKLEDFFEPALVVISDPWLDKNALRDAINVRIPVLGLC